MAVAPENVLAGLGIQPQAGELARGFICIVDFDFIAAAKLNCHGGLTDEGGQRTGRQVQGLLFTEHIHIVIGARRREQFRGVQQEGVEDQAAFFKAHTHFQLAGEDFLFDHAGHPRLARAASFGGVRIGIRGEGAVFGGRFLIAQPGAHLAVEGAQLLRFWFISKAQAGFLYG